MKYFLAVLILFTIYELETAAQKLSPISLISCEDTEKLIFLEYNKIEKGDEKAWSGNVTFPLSIDANTEFVLELRWSKNGAWDKTPQIIRGKCCFYLETFAKKLWQEVSEASKPHLESHCPIKPGTYVFDNYVADYSGIRLPMMKKGRCSGKLTITNERKSICAFLIMDVE